MLNFDKKVYWENKYEVYPERSTRNIDTSKDMFSIRRVDGGKFTIEYKTGRSSMYDVLYIQQGEPNFGWGGRFADLPLSDKYIGEDSVEELADKLKKTIEQIRNRGVIVECSIKYFTVTTVEETL